MRQPGDLARELAKVHDVLVVAEDHFQHEAHMNAALHMSREVRPAPLAAAIVQQRQELGRIIHELEKAVTIEAAGEHAHEGVWSANDPATVWCRLCTITMGTREEHPGAPQVPMAQ